MTNSRRQGREAALQALYLADLCRTNVDDLPAAVWSETPLPSKTGDFARRLARGVMTERERIDPVVVRYTKNWDLPRMASIDRCILRLATFELLHERDTPVNVIINEAVEIAKKYSTAESGKFVNGILDQIKQERHD